MLEHFKCFSVKILDYYNITVHSLVYNKLRATATQVYCQDQDSQKLFIMSSLPPRRQVTSGCGMDKWNSKPYNSAGALLLTPTLCITRGPFSGVKLPDGD